MYILSYKFLYFLLMIEYRNHFKLNHSIGLWHLLNIIYFCVDLILRSNFFLIFFILCTNMYSLRTASEKKRPLRFLMNPENKRSKTDDTVKSIIYIFLVIVYMQIIRVQTFSFQKKPFSV